MSIPVHDPNQQSQSAPRLEGHLPHFFLKQRITPVVNRYEIRAPGPDGQPGALLGMAQQKRMKLKEEVLFFADEARTQQLFSFKSRQVLDVAATTDVLDLAGNPIGMFRKDFKKSLLRSTWELHYADAQAVGTERSLGLAITRRLIELPFRFHFDFVLPNGAPVMSVQRIPTLRDRYEVSVQDPRLDVRVAAAMTVALDAFQGR